MQTVTTIGLDIAKSVFQVQEQVAAKMSDQGLLWAQYLPDQGQPVGSPRRHHDPGGIPPWTSSGRAVRSLVSERITAGLAKRVMVSFEFEASGDRRALEL